MNLLHKEDEGRCRSRFTAIIQPRFLIALTTHPRGSGWGRVALSSEGEDRGQLQYLRKPRGIPPRYLVHRDTEIVAWAPRAGRATIARFSSLTTEIYNEFPVQPGRKFARARPLVPTTLHKRYRERIAHSDLKQPFRQCGDASVRRRGCTQRGTLRAEKYVVPYGRSSRTLFFSSLLFILSLAHVIPLSNILILFIGFSSFLFSDVKLISFPEKFRLEGLNKRTKLRFER